MQALPGEGCRLSGNTDYRQAIRPVRGYVKVKDAIPQIISQWHPQRSFIRQNHNFLVVIRNTQLSLGASHALRSNTTDFGRLQTEQLSTVRVSKLSVNTGKGYFTVTLEVRCPADNSVLFRAEVYSSQPEAVSIGMGIDGSYLTDNNIFPAAGNLNPLDLTAGHGQPPGQVSRRQHHIYIFLKPLE